MNQLAVPIAPKPNERFVPSPRQEEIMRSLYRYEYLNQKQIQRLYFGEKTANYGYPLLKQLIAHRYCYAAVWHKKNAGKGENQYHLDTKGVALLKAQGFPPKGRLRKDKLPESNQFWDHLAALNHALISFELFARAHDTVSIEQLVHDFDFQRRRYQVRVADGTRQVVEPDGLIVFAITEQGRLRHQAVLIECDRGTEFGRADWFSKLDRLTGFLTQILPQEFGVSSIDVAVTTPDPHRRDVLRHWTHEALVRLSPPEDATQYFFTSVDPAHTPVREFLSGAHWHYFTDAEPLPLLKAPTEGERA